MAEAIAAFASLLGMGLSAQSRASEEREYRKGAKTIAKQMATVQGRLPGIFEYFQELEGLTAEGFGLEREGVGRDFLQKSFEFGEAREDIESLSGFKRSRTLSDIDRGTRFAREEYGLGIESLALAEQGEMLGIGRAREQDISEVLDTLFGLETAFVDRGGEITGNIEDFLGDLRERYGG